MSYQPRGYEVPVSLAVQTVIYQNEFPALVRAFRAVVHSAQRAKQKKEIENWVVRWGDCSPEETISQSDIKSLQELAANAGGAFEYLFFGENLGSAQGHNVLAGKSEDDLLLILNPDAEVSPTCIEKLTATLKEGVGSVEARQLPLEHPKNYDPRTLETAWSSTACLLTRKSAFDQVQGFDSKTFFLYCDDVDYSWQLKLRGWKVLYQPSATVFHDKRLGLGGEWLATSSEAYFSAEAALLLAYKYSRQDLVKHLTKLFAKGSAEQRQALDEFKLREKSGTLPTPVDGKHEVAQFIEGNYAKHRF